LSGLELEALWLAQHGLSNGDIADRLGYSDRTIRNRLHGLYGKLGAHRLTEAIRIARMPGPLDPLPGPQRDLDADALWIPRRAVGWKPSLAQSFRTTS